MNRCPSGSISRLLTCSGEPSQVPFVPAMHGARIVLCICMACVCVRGREGLRGDDREDVGN